MYILQFNQSNQSNQSPPTQSCPLKTHHNHLPTSHASPVVESFGVILRGKSPWVRCILGCWKIDYFFISADSTLLLFLLEEAGLLIGVHLFFSFSFSSFSFGWILCWVGLFPNRDITLPLLAIVNRDEYPNNRSEKFLTRKKTPPHSRGAMRVTKNHSVGRFPLHFLQPQLNAG